MKRLLFLVLGFLLFVSTYSQESDNRSMNESNSIQKILLQASEQILIAENDLNQEIVHLQIDLIQGEDFKWIYRILYPDWTYYFYAEGENLMVIDLDMEIRIQDEKTGKWYKIDEDLSPNYSTFLQTESPKSLSYAIGIKVAKYREGWLSGHFFLMITHNKFRDIK